MILSLRASLTFKMAALLVSALVLFAIVAFGRAQATVSDLTNRIVQQTSNSIEGRVSGLLNKAESNGRLLAGLLSPSTGSAPVLTDSSTFDSTAARMLELMRANPELGSVSFTLSRTGEHLRVVQRTNGQIRIEVSHLMEGDRQVREEKVPYGSSLRTLSTDEHWTEDFREAEWYKAALTSQKPVWTETYLFHNPPAPDTPGISYALPIFDRRNQFLGVVTVDFTISDLSRFIETINVGVSGYAALLEFDKLGVPRVVAHPQQNRLIINEGGKQKLAGLVELDDRPLIEASRSLGADHFTMGSGEVRRKTVVSNGRRYLVGYQKVYGESRPDWLMTVIVPEGEFMSGVWQTSVFLVFVTALLLVGVTVTSFLMAQRVAQPLQELAQETVRVRALDLTPRPVPPTNVREIGELGSAMEQMKTGLRSLEKLVPGDYARWLIGSGQEARLGGERRHLTTYFGDIIGFTALSEQMEPEELVDVLAEYLDVLSGEVLKLGGTVDKFNGDDVMAFWGAPNVAVDHAFLACKAAVGSQNTLSHLHNEWREDGRPLLRASFGISTGDVIVGNVGSRQRMNYTVIGDAVNLASRLQGLNKFYRTEVLISEQTREEVGDRIVSRLVDWVAVAGRDEPVPVFELLGLSQDATDAVRQLATDHTEAMALYRAREFHSALVKFNTILASWPHDGPARILMHRCENYLKAPPPDAWNGAHSMQVK